jgi:hypothetical protein
LIEENDQVMVDEGSVNQGLKETKQAAVVIPPFLGHRGNFSNEEVDKTPNYEYMLKEQFAELKNTYL